MIHEVWREVHAHVYAYTFNTLSLSKGIYVYTSRGKANMQTKVIHDLQYIAFSAPNIHADIAVQIDWSPSR